MLSNTTKENEMDFQEGKVVELNQEIPLSPHLVGLRVKMIRKTSTGRFTVETMEARGDYVLGERLHAMPYQLRERQERPEELQAAYADQKAEAIDEMQRMVRRGQQAREKVAKAILDGSNEALVNEMKWGNGVREDLLGTKAGWALSCVEEHGIEKVLEYLNEESTRSLMNNQFRANSTSLFSNAIEQERAVVAREIVEWTSATLRRLRRARAQMEVL